MFDVGENFLSPRDLLQKNGFCLNGPRISDTTKFIVLCLNLPQSVDAIKERAGISGHFYDQILDKLYHGIVAMRSIADDCGAIIGMIDAACSKTLEFEAVIESKLPRLFHLLALLRDNRSPETESEIRALNAQLIILANSAQRDSQAIDIGPVIQAWKNNQQFMKDVYNEFIKRMNDPQVQRIMEAVLGARDVHGLEKLKAWMEKLNAQTGPAMTDLGYLRGQFSLSFPFHNPCKILLFVDGREALSFRWCLLTSLEGSWQVVGQDASVLEEFLREPHSPMVDRVLKIEQALLLRKWRHVKDEATKLREEHLKQAVIDIDRAHRLQ
ncbi:hypothetical protein CNMCM8980_002381 [Aspergillus fumigatiaffinis]|nr:hypothetical protein CNMCM8980_002381 [Aspergillus fumigatiaffinis]